MLSSTSHYLNSFRSVIPSLNIKLEIIGEQAIRILEFSTNLHRSIYLLQSSSLLFPTDYEAQSVPKLVPEAHDRGEGILDHF